MTITAQELSQKRSQIIPGLEFVTGEGVIYRDAESTIKVTSVATVDKTSCWGDYQQDVVYYEVITQASKRTYVTKQRADGSTYHQEQWVPDHGKFNTRINYMSLPSFIEYIFNKRKAEA